MCFAGFFDFSKNLKEKENLNTAAVRRMVKRASYTADDFYETHISEHSAAAYAFKEYCKVGFAADSNCEAFTVTPEQSTPAKTALALYETYGKSFAEYIDGCLLGAVIDKKRKVIILFRGENCASELFYSFIGDRIFFSSAIRGLFELSEINAVFSFEGIRHLFDCGCKPAAGTTVYNNIYSLPKSHCVIYESDSFSLHRYCSKMPPKGFSEPSDNYDFKSKGCSEVTCHYPKERALSLLLETAIIRDMPSYTAQEDLIFHHAKQYKKNKSRKAPSWLLHPNLCRNPIAADSTYRSDEPHICIKSNSVDLPIFSPMLQAKLKAFMRDKTQPIHRFISLEAVNLCLSDPIRFERELFFLLQTCLWLNHYKVYIAL